MQLLHLAAYFQIVFSLQIYPNLKQVSTKLIEIQFDNYGINSSFQVKETGISNLDPNCRFYRSESVVLSVCDIRHFYGIFFVSDCLFSIEPGDFGAHILERTKCGTR